MSDDRSPVTESNEEKFEKKNCQDNDHSREIGVEVPEKDRPGELFVLLERSSIRTAESEPVIGQQFSSFRRDIPDDLIDGTERDFPMIKNSGNSRILRLKRSKDDNPDGERNEPESTYSGETIHHERNVAGDRKSDKFVPSEVAKDTGTGSQRTVEYHDEVDRDKGNGDNDSDDNGNRRVTTFSAMDKSPKSLTDESKRIVGEASTPAIDKGQEDHNSCDVPQVEVPSDFRGSPQLRRKFSRTKAVRDDARRLKTATLERMGKMFKPGSAQILGDEPHEDSYGDHQTRKEKTNSLGRMFKLVDKNGEPRKLFPQSRTGSLSHILRRKSTGAENDNSIESTKSRGVFSRLLNQWKNRSGSGNAAAEPDLCASTAEEDKSSSPKSPSTSGINLSSSCTNSLQIPTLSAPISSLEKTAEIEYPA